MKRLVVYMKRCPKHLCIVLYSLDVSWGEVYRNVWFLIAELKVLCLSLNLFTIATSNTSVFKKWCVKLTCCYTLTVSLKCNYHFFNKGKCDCWKKILRWVRSSGVKATSSEGKREYILWKNENFHIEYTRIDDAFNTGPLFLLCSFLHLFECIPIFAFFFFIVFYFCTFSSCITMTRNNCEHMLLACDNNPHENLFREALTTLLFLYIFIFVLNIENELFLALFVVSDSRFRYFLSEAMWLHFNVYCMIWSCLWTRTGYHMSRVSVNSSSLIDRWRCWFSFLLTGLLCNVSLRHW